MEEIIDYNPYAINSSRFLINGIYVILLAYTKSAINDLTDTPYSYRYIIYIYILLLLLSYCHTPPLSPTGIGMGGKNMGGVY